MHLRPCNPFDLSSMASIQVACELDDPLANYVVKEGSMATHAASYRMISLHFLRQVLLNPGTLAWVVESDDHDVPPDAASQDFASHTRKSDLSTGGQVIGWAVWTRHGTGKVAQNWKRASETISSKIEVLLHAVKTWYINFYNPLEDRNHKASVEHIMRSDFDREIFTEYWQLEGCYIDPKWQRRGAGKLALRWGMAQAQAEAVPIVMKASPKGVALYERNGFRRVRREEFGEFFDTGGEGYWQMVWEAEDWGALEKVKGNGRTLR